MEQIQNSAIEEDDEHVVEDNNKKSKTKKLPKKFRKSDKIINNDIEDKTKRKKDYTFRNHEENETHNKYSREANIGNSRSKRATRPKEENKNTCSLFIQTDPLIWRHITEQVGGIVSYYVHKIVKSV